MNPLGTIDQDGIRADLQNIAQNNYPKIQLLKLPMNLGAGQIYQVPLRLPGNNFVLTYEAMDEDGTYNVSVPAPASLNPGGAQTLAQGFVRFNKFGPWLPVSMFSPLMQGLASTSQNYTNNPIVGAGYSSIQTPIQTLEWQVLSAYQQSGQMLAFFGMNFGLRGGIGNGSGSTYAIPNASGPIARLKAAKCACCL